MLRSSRRATAAENHKKPAAQAPEATQMYVRERATDVPVTERGKRIRIRRRGLLGFALGMTLSLALPAHAQVLGIRRWWEMMREASSFGPVIELAD